MTEHSPKDPLSDRPQRDLSSRRTWNTRRPLLMGMFAVFALLGSLGYWSVKTHITGAVIGKGTIEVSTNKTAVSHPIGGVVQAIHARDGDQVKAGDLVVTLDSFALMSELNIIEGELFETLANIARLEAESDATAQMTLHPVLQKAQDTRPEIKALVARQSRRLLANLDAIKVKQALLDEQASQIDAQIEGAKAQLEAAQQELALSLTELKKSEQLAEKGLMKSADLLRLRSGVVSLQGKIGNFKAKVAELGAKTAEVKLKSHSVIPDARDLAEVELTKLRPLRTKGLEKRAGLLDALTKLEIRVPISGKVHDSKVQGLRSVIVAAKPVMMIVPDSEPIVVGVRVAATDIDQVYQGQEASLKFQAFGSRDIPIILGRVKSISGDVFEDPKTRTFYYEVKVELLESELEKLGEKHLIPGMPVQAFMTTESRTPLNYVLRPLMVYFDRAFRDT